MIKQCIILILVMFSLQKAHASDSLSIYPNPFKDSTTIFFQLSQANDASIAIYNAIGEIVYSDLTQFLQAGSYIRIFHADTLRDGVYILKLKIGSTQIIRKLSKNHNASKISERDFIFSNIVLYPNPANSYINVKIVDCPANGCTILIYDTLGRLVRQEYYDSNNTEMRLNELHKGIYSICIPYFGFTGKISLINY